MAKKIPHLSIPSIGNLPIEIKLYGDWHKAIELVDNLGPSIKKGYDTAVNKFSNCIIFHSYWNSSKRYRYKLGTS